MSCSPDSSARRTRSSASSSVKVSAPRGAARESCRGVGAQHGRPGGREAAVGEDLDPAISRARGACPPMSSQSARSKTRSRDRVPGAHTKARTVWPTAPEATRSSSAASRRVLVICQEVTPCAVSWESTASRIASRSSSSPNGGMGNAWNSSWITPVGKPSASTMTCPPSESASPPRGAKLQAEAVEHRDVEAEPDRDGHRRGRPVEVGAVRQAPSAKRRSAKSRLADEPAAPALGRPRLSRSVAMSARRCSAPGACGSRPSRGSRGRCARCGRGVDEAGEHGARADVADGPGLVRPPLRADDVEDALALERSQPSTGAAARHREDAGGPDRGPRRELSSQHRHGVGELLDAPAAVLPPLAGPAHAAERGRREADTEPLLTAIIRSAGARPAPSPPRRPRPPRRRRGRKGRVGLGDGVVRGRRRG